MADLYIDHIKKYRAVCPAQLVFERKSDVKKFPCKFARVNIYSRGRNPRQSAVGE